MTPTPFCCDTNSGSEQERNEFKRIFEKASEVDWSFNSNYYGFNYLNEWDSWNRLENIKMYFNGNILPLSEGIAILKKMIGEEEKPKEDISIYVNSIRSNFEMWQKGEIKDGAFSWHLQNNLLHIEKILQPKP